ncbi:hypothetical protein [Kaistia defluvii]|uniref:Uncharacterized protein n=1 Tax=Kaistia defluvii TaxID=410841 RepID=A0ABV2R4B8_9HYPH
MRASDLVRLFSTRESGPIDLYDDIIPAIKEAGEFEVYFWKADIDTNILKGRIVEESHFQGDDEIRVVSIDYAASMSNELSRLVCAKELIHVLDPIDQRVTTDEAVNDLISKIILPTEMQSLDDGVSVWGDRYGYLFALAVLFPWQIRELLYPKYASGQYNIDDIASLMELPVEYVQIVMSPLWQRVHHILSA